MQQDLDDLRASFPSTADSVDRISELRDLTSVDAWTPIFEPRSLIEVVDGKPTLLTVDANGVNAWRRHVADGSSARMRSLEIGVTAELRAGRITSAMAVARAHMEVAGLAALSCNVLYEAGGAGEFKPVEVLILGTYFGSSMRIQVKGTPVLGEFLRPEEVRPLRTGQMIKAMDDFRAGGGEPGTHCQLTYGLLSEYAHPAMRATSSSFADVISESAEGWQIRYHEGTGPDEASVNMVLEILLSNMRIGHASVALLNHAEVTDSDGAFGFEGPSLQQVHSIYEQLLQQQPD